MAVSIGPFQNIVNVGWSVNDTLTLEYRSTSHSDAAADNAARISFPQIPPLHFFSTAETDAGLFTNHRFIDNEENSGVPRAYNFAVNTVNISQSWTIVVDGDTIPVSGNSAASVEVDTYPDDGSQFWFVVGGSLSGVGDLDAAVAAILADVYANSTGLANFSASVTAGAQTDSGSGTNTPPGAFINTHNSVSLFGLFLLKPLLPSPRPATIQLQVEVFDGPSLDDGPGDLAWFLRASTFKGKSSSAFPVDSHAERVGWPAPPTGTATASGHNAKIITFTITLSDLSVSVLTA